MIILVAYCQPNRGIGFQNRLPWHLPEDLKQFRRWTEGQVVVMGRKTYDSLPRKPLPNRINVVLSRSAAPADKPETVYWVNSVSELLETLQLFSAKQVFVIGGEQIYQTVLRENLVSEIRATQVKEHYEADTFFPELDLSWQLSSCEEHPDFSYLVLKPSSHS